MRLLYISPISAESYAQRPHFMVRDLLDRGVSSVLWVNPYPCRLPQWADLGRSTGLHNQGTSLDPRVRALNVRALPIEPLPLGTWLNRQLLWRGVWREIEPFAASDEPLLVGVGRPCALAVAALQMLRPAASFYDAMDNFPEFHGGLSRRSMRRCEDAIGASVDVVLASSTFLAEKFSSRGRRVEQVLNACSLPISQSPSLQVSKSPFPVLGYVGCIGRWFDWPLVIRLAKTMPQARVELVGPCVTPPPAREKLPPNVQLLPACNQSEASAHLARFSAGLIPFRLNALTAGVDPIKYYEYRAAGLPVLSTRFGEMSLRGSGDGVYFLDGVNDWASVAAALDRKSDSAAAARFARENSWDFRFRQSQYFQTLLPASRIRRAA
jgi:glycosyltransferase involved in cell wall biosynthesis